MRILITNDDGIESEGLYALAKEFERERQHEIIIAAPHTQRSAASHSITISKHVLVKEVKLAGLKSKAFSIGGTPADCTKIAIEKLCNREIDFIISGINYGTNLGNDVIYSGTVSAVVEGAFYGIPGFAVSTNVEKAMDYTGVVHITKDIIDSILKEKLDNSLLININVPMKKYAEIKGVKISRLGSRIYTDCYTEKLFEDDTKGYLLEGYPSDSDENDTDIFYFNEGYATVTPLQFDLTHYKKLDLLKDHIKNK